MTKHLTYLKYVLTHKYWVFRAGLIIGPEHPYQWLVWIWRLLIHDWTKFLPDEYFPYANHDFSRDDEYEDPDFDLAWNHHQKRNRHHYQYYLLRNDNGTEKCLEMAALDAREMLADWASFSLKMGKDFAFTKHWYLKGYHQKVFHPLTRQWLDNYLGVTEDDLQKSVS